MKKALVWLLWQIDIWGSVLSSWLVRLTGKSSDRIHPKHFLGTQWHRWYLAHIEPGDMILDVGCGNAMHTIACAKHCRKAYGFDYSFRQLGIGRAQACQAGLNNVCLTEGDVEAPWNFRDGCFDKVVFLDVLEHLCQRDFALREAYRVLQSDGWLLLSVPQRATSWKKLRGSVGLPACADRDHKVEYKQEEIEEALALNGFICESIEPIVYDTWWAGPIDLVGGLSLALYRRLAQWKREMVLQRPAESTGFRIVARKRVN